MIIVIVGELIVNDRSKLFRKFVEIFSKFSKAFYIYGSGGVRNLVDSLEGFLAQVK